MYALPAVAYSIGSGVQVHALAQAIGAGTRPQRHCAAAAAGAPQMAGQSGSQLPGGIGGLSLSSNTMPRPQADVAGLLLGARRRSHRRRCTRERDGHDTPRSCAVGDLLVTVLAGCAGHPPMPQPSGPLRTMNPGLWNYHGNDVVPQASSKGLAIMSDLTDQAGRRPAGFVPRGAGLDLREAAFRAAESFERERRWMAFLTGFGGWIVAAVLAVLLALSLLLVLRRPVPHQKLLIAVLHGDGTYSAPVPVNDLSPSQQALLLKNTIWRYVVARESYTWEAVQHDYDVVSALSAGPLQARYQKFMLDASKRPTAVFGKRGDVSISDVHIFRVAPNAMEVGFPADGPAARCSREAGAMIARVTYAPSGKIPITVRQQYDPAGILITKYDVARNGPQ